MRDKLGAAALLTASGLFAATCVVVRLTHVDPTLTAEDRAALSAIDLWGQCSAVGDFAGQVACTRAIHTWLGWNVPDLKCHHEWGVLSHEPAGYLARGAGCCYDRARLIEKTLALYGLETRHVAIYATDGTGRSHSVVEVRTDRGWMLVDTLEPWLALDGDGGPLDTAAIRAPLQAGRPEDIALFSVASSSYFDGRFFIVYGLYSRHGGFFEPFVPLPDIDWTQLHHNVVLGADR